MELPSSILISEEGGSSIAISRQGEDAFVHSPRVISRMLTMFLYWPIDSGTLRLNGSGRSLFSVCVGRVDGSHQHCRMAKVWQEQKEKLMSSSF